MLQPHIIHVLLSRYAFFCKWNGSLKQIKQLWVVFFHNFLCMTRLVKKECHTASSMFSFSFFFFFSLYLLKDGPKANWKAEKREMLICCCSGQSHEASVVFRLPKVTADWEANVTQCILQFNSFEFTGHYSVSLIHTLDLYYFLVSLDLVSNFNKCYFFFFLPYLVHFCLFGGINWTRATTLYSRLAC